MCAGACHWFMHLNAGSMRIHVCACVQYSCCNNEDVDLQRNSRARVDSSIQSRKEKRMERKRQRQQLKQQARQQPDNKKKQTTAKKKKTTAKTKSDLRRKFEVKLHWFNFIRRISKRTKKISMFKKHARQSSQRDRAWLSCMCCSCPLPLRMLLFG